VTTRLPTSAAEIDVAADPIGIFRRQSCGQAAVCGRARPVPRQQFMEARGRIIGNARNRSASQARGSISFSLAVTISDYIAAARTPPRSEPANNQALRPGVLNVIESRSRRRG
jgi:hypothetical protein